MAKTEILFVFILILMSTMGYSMAGNAGYFWQISDLHMDQNYSIRGDSKHMCHGNMSNSTISPYGNYNCDAPWDLIKDTISAMKFFHPTPDFILWTGDIMPHLPDKDVTWSEVFSGLFNATNQMLKTFPGHILLPVIGNHDVHPANLFPETGFDEVYVNYLTKAKWGNLIPNDQHVNFVKGGYYVKKIDNQLQIIVMNTNIYLSHNKEKPKSEDPGGQLQWLKDQLISAKINSYKVIITAHAPPGYFERNPIEPFLVSPYSEKFVQLVIDYADVILTQVYGHTHTDTFRLFMDSHGVVRSHGFIAPSVSPLKITATNGINPSIRLYSYDVAENMVLDYEQYYLNISDVTGSGYWNRDKYERANVELPWKLLYTATELYGVNNLNLLSLYHVYLDISTNRELFEKYYLYNVAGVKTESCSETCHRIHICAITELTKTDMDKCMNFHHFSTSPAYTVKPTDGHSRPVPANRKLISRQMRFVILGVALGLFIMLIIMTVIASVFCVRRKFSTGFRYQKHNVLQ
uniref:Uncharacterized protein n=1 Tax=Strigamia maritima TaxID=126957 RepID=T1ITW0_STRMM